MLWADSQGGWGQATTPAPDFMCRIFIKYKLKLLTFCIIINFQKLPSVFFHDLKVFSNGKLHENGVQSLWKSKIEYLKAKASNMRSFSDI